MIAALPHDLQECVWESYTAGLHERRLARHPRVAARALENILALCDGDAEACDYLLDWIAHMLLHPDVKPSRGVALVGGEGANKCVLTTLLSRLVPTLVTHDPRDVVGKHNARMVVARLVVLQEPHRPGSPALKQLLSDSTLVVHDPFERAVPSSHRLLLTAEAMPAARSLRVIRCTDRSLGTHSGLLHELLTTPALDALRQLLLARPVPARF